MYTHIIYYALTIFIRYDFVNVTESLTRKMIITCNVCVNNIISIRVSLPHIHMYYRW